MKSHPVRVRGLKQICPLNKIHVARVAPRAGAWIETSMVSNVFEIHVSHPVRVRGLKHMPL